MKLEDFEIEESIEMPVRKAKPARNRCIRLFRRIARKLGLLQQVIEDDLSPEDVLWLLFRDSPSTFGWNTVLCINAATEIGLKVLAEPLQVSRTNEYGIVYRIFYQDQPVTQVGLYSSWSDSVATMYALSSPRREVSPCGSDTNSSVQSNL